MTDQFVGTGLPLDQHGLSESMDRIGIGAAELWAILNVETRGCGFLFPFMIFHCKSILLLELVQHIDKSFLLVKE